MNAGDFMIYGVPLGEHIFNYECRFIRYWLFFYGTPEDFKLQGFPESDFEWG